MMHVLYSQDLAKTLRKKTILIRSDTTQIDTLCIVPGSGRIYDENGILLYDSDLYLDAITGNLVIRNNHQNFMGKTVTLEYRVLPVNFGQDYYHRDTLLILDSSYKKNNRRIYQPVKKENFFEDDQLDKNGSISRGIVIGNQRDLGTISNFNLQLSGKLNDEVSVLAAVSDNNMPIQPEGNTQQLQEFDKVNILMYTKNSGLELGDIALNKPTGYFLNLKKQTRGIRAYTNFSKADPDKPKLHSAFAAGLAKGKYNRQLFNGLEGNQGPYKLLGNNYESYIIILSGSEKIYLNGKLLTRGDQFDYLIDYNTAEITFTANQPITKDSRIVAEFEYSQQYFPRLQFFQTNDIVLKKSRIWLNSYLETDNKNDPLAETYTGETRLFLSNLGDNIENAYAPNIRNVGYSGDKILYFLKDTLVLGNYYDSIFVYSTDAEKAVYQLGFSYVGEYQGNYRPINTSANGKVYEWVAPVGGIKQGSYEPVSLFVTPKRLLMTNLGGDFSIGSQGNAGFEIALSLNDVNTYSAFDKSNDVGYAIKMYWNQGVLKIDTNRVKLNIFGDLQLVNKNFHPVETYHEVEFERGWNLPVQAESWQELNYNLGFAFNMKKIGNVAGKLSMMERSKSYNGQKAGFSATLGNKSLKLITNVSYLNTKDQFNSTNYLKHMFILSQNFRYWSVGISEESEQNRWYIRNIDSLTRNSFKFNELGFFVKSPDTLLNNFFISAKLRNDFLPGQNDFKKWNNAQTLQGGFRLAKRQDLNFKTILTYRKLQVEDTINHTQHNEEYLSGREEMNLRFLKGGILLSGFYETGSGLEIKKQFQFIEVQSGQGQYTWFDYNNNNIKELDEFEPAKFFDQANFQMIFIPGDQYVRVYTTQLSQTLFLQSNRIWRSPTGFRSFVASFTDQFAFQMMQKSEVPDFVPDFSDKGSLVSRNLFIRNNLAYKGKNRKLQLEYLFDMNNSINLMINGTDLKQFEGHSFKLRYRISKIFNMYNTLTTSQKGYESEYFEWKNYSINLHSEEMKFEFQAIGSLVSGISYKITAKSNAIGIETAKLNELKYSAVYDISLKTNLQADFSYISASYNGESNSSIEYEMLDGLKAGKNLLWSVSLNQKLSKVLFLNIIYSGRATQKNQTIHNGGIQLKANF